MQNPCFGHFRCCQLDPLCFAGARLLSTGTGGVVRPACYGRLGGGEGTRDVAGATPPQPDRGLYASATQAAIVLRRLFQEWTTVVANTRSTQPILNVAALE